VIAYVDASVLLLLALDNPAHCRSGADRAGVSSALITIEPKSGVCGAS
jgi:hypothetical protein